MKRLFSYFEYNFVFFPIITALILFTLYPFSDNWGFAIFIILFGIIAFYRSLNSYKRVFVKDSSLFIYDLFSSNCAKVDREQVITFDHMMFTSMYYRIKFIDINGKEKSVYFMKNLFILNMKEIVRSFKTIS